mmetsp:Transcript_13860/g.21124  ORF Transcript_13860/g.21124 Transcript_13860/m.21124 type:complete len:261 (-) Transcript_13860:39-821(-)
MNRNTFTSQHPNRLDSVDNDSYSEKLSSSLYPTDCMIPNNLDELETMSQKRNRRRKSNSSSLYPSSSSMPEIPLADDVFDKLGKENDSCKKDSSFDKSPFKSEENLSFGFERRQNPCSYNPQEQNSIEYPAEPVDRPLIEISPGHWIELRGSDETLKAFQRNFIRQVTCSCCSNQIQCIEDAAMVLCPICRVVTPIDDVIGRGLGLGMKMQSPSESNCKYSKDGSKSEHDYADRSQIRLPPGLTVEYSPLASDSLNRHHS